MQIEILYCGVCHSDLHQVRNEWQSVMPTVYPCVPGHEIIGRVVKAGSAVKKFKEGDIAGVGCMVDSDRTCPACQSGEEQFCDPSATLTYNAEDKILGGVTYGGYSQSIVVDEAFALRVPRSLSLPARRHCFARESPRTRRCATGTSAKGKKWAWWGWAALGTWALNSRRPLALTWCSLPPPPGRPPTRLRLGADEVVVSTDAAQMQKHAGSFDFILDTASAEHDLNAYLQLVKLNGTMTLVGAPEKPTPVSAFALLFRRRQLAGSIIGGIRETQEMLDFCADHGIASDIEMIPIQQINEAYERLLKGDVKYRFVIDMASLK